MSKFLAGQELAAGEPCGQRLKRQSQSLHEAVLDPLHICYDCSAQGFCGTLNSGSEGVYKSFACSWGPFHAIGLPDSALV